MASLAVLRFPDFASLPYTVQEHIVDLISDYKTYLALALSTKYLSELCFRTLYQSLEFSGYDVGRKRWPSQKQYIQINNVRYLQSLYVQTLRRKPEISSFTQYLSWEMSDDQSWTPPSYLPIEDMWEAFEHLTAVRTLRLKAGIASDAPAPPAPLFPNLVSVYIEGSFTRDALERILHTSPYIKELHIAKNTKSYLFSPGKTYPNAYTIVPFLRTSIAKRTFRGLRKLTLGLEGYVEPELAVAFMEMSAPRLEALRIEYDFGGPVAASEAFETILVPMFQSGKWKRLRKVVIVECDVPEDAEERLRPYCPLIENVSRWEE
ncbi:hypothetical protein BDV93DRAFT_527177 [Ceratobasidium sp. AG-I]|nr:hypothetical protein BDV93DRAFT_527177 [Ceratobasidium sp. AG-I]